MSIVDRHPELADPEFVQNFNFEDCWTRLHPEAPIGVFDVAVALLASRGNFSRVARALGRSRRAVETFVLRNLEVRDLYEDVCEEFLDEVFYTLGNIALSGHPGSCQFILSTVGRNRGFGGGVAESSDDRPPDREMSLTEMVEEAKRRGLPLEGLL